MTVLKVIKWPDQRLKEVSSNVPLVDDKVRKFMDDMLDTMHAENGIGLAAVQVGVMQRILLMDLEPNDRYPELEAYAGVQYFINPEIVSHCNTKIEFEEGCLSFPDLFAKVKRYEEVEVKYLDYDGIEQLKKFTGMMAICFQHELDHLNGVTFVDHLSRIKRNIALKKYIKNLQ